MSIRECERRARHGTGLVALPQRLLARLAVGVFVLALSANTADAYLPLYERASEVAQQGELIVVGGLKPGSVEYLPDVRKSGNPPQLVTDCVPRALLIVKTVEAGELTQREITIWFRGTAVPVVAGNFDWTYSSGGRMRIHRKGVGKDIVQIYEINNSAYTMNAGRDICEDHVWFLRSHSGLVGMQEGETGWCLDSPQYIVPTSEKDYYMAYRARDVAAALKAQLKSRPDRAQEIQTYLQKFKESEK